MKNLTGNLTAQLPWPHDHSWAFFNEIKEWRIQEVIKVLINKLWKLMIIITRKHKERSGLIPNPLQTNENYSSNSNYMQLLSAILFQYGRYRGRKRESYVTELVTQSSVISIMINIIILNQLLKIVGEWKIFKTFEDTNQFSFTRFLPEYCTFGEYMKATMQ